MASSISRDSSSNRAVSSAPAVWFANAITAGRSDSRSPGPMTEMAPMAWSETTSGAEITVFNWSSSLRRRAFPAASGPRTIATRPTSSSWSPMYCGLRVEQTFCRIGIRSKGMKVPTIGRPVSFVSSAAGGSAWTKAVVSPFPSGVRSKKYVDNPATASRLPTAPKIALRSRCCRAWTPASPSARTRGVAAGSSGRLEEMAPAI